MKGRRSAAAIVRLVRLTGGMVLMAYVTGHLTNLAFGLVSLDMLDRLRIPLMAPWQGIPGQVLLYSALASYLALGLFAVAQRRSVASLNRADAAQLALGLLIPLFLVWHVLRTRGAIVSGGDHATYAVLMVNYWRVTPFFGLLQVLGLVESRADVAQRRMQAAGIVEALNILEEVSAGLGADAINPMVDPLGLHAVKEALHWRVIQTIAFAAHRGCYA